jgi:hypothetical protein
MCFVQFLPVRRNAWAVDNGNRHVADIALVRNGYKITASRITRDELLKVAAFVKEQKVPHKSRKPLAVSRHK